MIKTKDGLAMLIGTSYLGSKEYLLRAGGGSTRDGTPTIINGTTNLLNLVTLSAIINGTLTSDSATLGNLLITGASQLGIAQVTTINNYTLADACTKMVDTSITANTTSLNLPTSKAVEDRINTHLGIDKVGTLTNIIEGTGISVSGTSTINPTISINTTYLTYISHGEEIYNQIKNEVYSTGTISDSAGVILDAKWTELPKAIYDSALTKNGTYLILIEWGSVIYTGIFPYKELHQNTTYMSDGDCPVINTSDEIELTIIGHISEDIGRLYLKLAAGSRTTTETIANYEKQMPTKPSLYIATNKPGQSLNNLSFKFRQLI